jgi:hypothetical protein
MHWRRWYKEKERGYSAPFIHHGGSNTPEFHSWSGAKRRCYIKTNPKYPEYGARGIKVCSRWLGAFGFTNFLEDMGKKPGSNYSLNRIDNDGDYAPDNCEWATKHQQASNKRNNNKTVGVYYDERYQQKWYVKLSVDKKIVFYGRFTDEVDAIQARRKAEQEYVV